MIEIVENSFNEKMGYFKITLSNREKVLLTRREFSDLKIKDNHNHILLESTSGNFYKPITLSNNEICFKLR